MLYSSDQAKSKLRKLKQPNIYGHQPWAFTVKWDSSTFDAVNFLFTMTAGFILNSLAEISIVSFTF